MDRFRCFMLTDLLTPGGGSDEPVRSGNDGHRPFMVTDSLLESNLGNSDIGTVGTVIGFVFTFIEGVRIGEVRRFWKAIGATNTAGEFQIHGAVGLKAKHQSLGLQGLHREEDQQQKREESARGGEACHEYRFSREVGTL